jgi:arginase family enzyme
VIPGKSKAPKAFRDVGVVSQLRGAGISVSEHHALEQPANYAAVDFQPGSVRNEDMQISVCESVESSLRKSLGPHGQTPPFQLVLGGECCMLPAILSAFWKRAYAQSPPRRVGLVYIDADTDLSSPTDPDSTGNFAGMNMTHLVHRPGSLKRMKQFAQPNGDHVCDSSNMVLFGTNMSLPGNKREHFAYLFDNDYKVVTSSSIARDPEQRAMAALKYLEDRADIIFVHLDVDAIDPQMFPLANVPNFTGVEFPQMMRALKVFLGSDKVCGLSIAEVNPDHDPGLDMVKRLNAEIVGMLGARSKLGGKNCR